MIIYLLAAAFIGVPQAATFASGVVSQQCMQCICDVESGCRPVGCQEDQGSDSCGYFQIKHDYWIDCGRLDGDWHRCANNLDCASRCVQAYMKRYSHNCPAPLTCQDYARLHNGGPHGCTHSNTLTYWHKVHSKGC